MINQIYSLILICLLLIPANAHTQHRFQAVDIFSKKAEETVASGAHRIYRPYHDVQLGVVLTTRSSTPTEKNRYFSVFDQLIIAEDTINAAGELSLSETVIRWYQILPQKIDTLYYNYYHNLLPWARVQYEEQVIAAWNDQWQVKLASLPRYNELFPGTIWLKVAVAQGRQYVQSPAMESRQTVPQGDYGGLNAEVFRISVAGQNAHSLIDNLLTFRNVPVIINPGSWNNTWADHQTTNWIGGNMRSFIVFAAELAGRSLAPYRHQFPLPQLNNYRVTDYYTRRVFLSEDRYLMNWEQPVKLDPAVFGVGDLIYKNQQLSVFYQDRSPVMSAHRGYPNGWLDTTDQIITIQQGILDIYPLGTAVGDSLILIRWKERWPTAE